MGTIDLVRGKGDEVDLVDFKSGRKPDATKDKDKLERYRRQVQLYAYLLKQERGDRVNELLLYFTGDDGDDPTYTVSKDEGAIRQTVEEFDAVAHKILSKDFSAKTADSGRCERCDFKRYCEREESASGPKTSED